MGSDIYAESDKIIKHFLCTTLAQRWYVHRHKGRIVSSASSFITFEGEVELDVSTEEEYRGNGLATACVRLMLRDCMERGIIVHWDAQNDISRRLAEKFGFEFECEYPVYVLPKGE